MKEDYSRRRRSRSRSRDRQRSRSQSRSPKRAPGKPQDRRSPRRHRHGDEGGMHRARSREAEVEAHRHDHRASRDDGHRDHDDRHRHHDSHTHQQYPPPPPPPPPGPGPHGGGPPERGGYGEEGRGRGGRDKEPEEPEPEPDFGYSGKLVEETNKVNGVVVKYVEPPETKMPGKNWRLYIFKNNQLMDKPLYIHKSSWYMFGRERRIVDIPTDHPSCSKQHAVLQYRAVEVANEYGVNQQVVKPYLMDLGSVNGSFINGERVEASRYYELQEKDVIKFGSSSREYILLHEESAG